VGSTQKQKYAAEEGRERRDELPKRKIEGILENLIGLLRKLHTRIRLRVRKREVYYLDEERVHN